MSNTPPIEVTLRTKTNETIPLTLGADAQRQAMSWRYKLRSRSRWVNEEKASRAQELDCQETLKSFGVDGDRLWQLAKAEVAEVSIPFLSEGADWVPRLMPWEYLLSGATRHLRNNVPLLVCRHLNVIGPTPPPLPRPPKRLLFVGAAPIELQNSFSFEAKARVLQRAVGRGLDFDQLNTPTRRGVRERLANLPVDVIHVAGVDTHEGLAMLGLTPNAKQRDGILLQREIEQQLSSDSASSRTTHDQVNDIDVALLFTGGVEKPTLVTYNVFNSAARLAALTVAQGAGAAIGFEDVISNEVAEAFFATFYQQWRANAWSAHEAFGATWATLRQHRDTLVGTGVVLWTARSMFDPALASVVQPIADIAATQLPVAVVTAPEPVAQKRRGGRTKGLVPPVAPLAIPPTAAPPEVPRVEEEDAVHVELKVVPQINYSLLHNQRFLFETFVIRNVSSTMSQRVTVTVQLNAGADSPPCRLTKTVTDNPWNVAADVQVPLIGTLSRSVRENMRTTLTVEVRDAKDRVAYQQPHAVTLVPIDQWKDDDTNRQWLPSFVLPRDPTVPSVIDSAQRYLMALRDDPGAGFDGYQSFDRSAADPAEAIDLQVQAIWASLLYDWPLSYINPPPTFGAFSQRLRSPSDVVGGKRGTCIDLALLLASCLEYVDIHPVLFLLEGHAFSGYWRDPDGYERFKKVVPPPTVEDGAGGWDDAVSTLTQTIPWLFGADRYREIFECVQRGDLRLVETVCLTQRSSFAEAAEEGRRNLQNPAEFQSMMDVKIARERDVTPLPIASRPA